MSQSDKSRHFASLHIPGAPLELYNIWDAGSARAIAGEGAKALATGSAGVAAAQGYGDGEQIPLGFVLQLVERIVASVPDLPVSVDFEGGYAKAPQDLGPNIAAVIGAGAVGINFEDQIVGGAGLYSTEDQAARIRAVRQAASKAEEDFFINARTDLFLKSDPATHAAHLPEALARAQSYAEAGASGFFVPGLTDPALIEKICKGTRLPVNVLVSPSAPPTDVLAECGVARLSHGPFPYRALMRSLAEGYAKMVANRG